jgi:hypothetical protein
MQIMLSGHGNCTAFNHSDAAVLVLRCHLALLTPLLVAVPPTHVGEVDMRMHLNVNAYNLLFIAKSFFEPGLRK